MASKRESSFINMVSTLVLVTGIAALALGGIYNITKGPIEEAKLRKQQEAIKTVLPAFQSLETRMYKSAKEADSLQFNLAYDEGGQLVGVAVNTFTNRGFSGNIKVMVGFLPDGTINNTSVLEHKETPGLGDKMQQNKGNWSLQYNGVNPAAFDLRMTKDGGQVDAITAATITARAFSDAIQRAYDTFEQNKGDF
jgi:electron transport complex protein RnfG